MGLLRSAARTAVVASTATRVHGRVAARQQGAWADQTAAPPRAEPAPGPPAATVPAPRDPGALLGDLRELRDAGVLTDTEFEAQKARILAG